MDHYTVHTQVGRRQSTATTSTTLAVGEIAGWLAGAFRDTAAAVAASGAHIAGPPFARYHQLAEAQFEVEAGFPTDRPISDDGRVHASELPGGSQAVIEYMGPYDAMEGAYQALYAWVAGHHGTPAGDAWEAYFTDPAIEPDPQKWRTDVVLPYQAG